MDLLDVNVVLAAHRADHPDHTAVRAWFDRMLDQEMPFTVPSVVWGSFLRVSTSRRIFAVPTSVADAFTFIDAVCAQPSFLLTSTGPRHLVLLKRMCEEGDASGDLVPDAVIGAIALEHGCDVVTLDRDFARFPSIRHVRPSARA